jgi:hypothetical protein
VRRLAPLLVVLALFGCGGGSDPGDPGLFVTTLIRDLGSGRTGEAWDQLHPLHQEEVPRAHYVACERQDGFGGKVTKIDVLEVKDEQATIPGEFEQRPSTAVTVGVTLAVPDAAAPEKFTLTAHIFESEGEWAWVIGPVDYAAYKTGVCPSQE